MRQKLVSWADARERFFESGLPSTRMQKYRENEIINADAKDLARYVRPNSVALTVTSPPYRNAINYAQDVANAKNSDDVWMRGTGEEKTGAYMDSMQAVFDQVFAATKEGGFCCIVIGDEVVKGKLIPLPSLMLSRLASAENEDDPSEMEVQGHDHMAQGDIWKKRGRKPICHIHQASIPRLFSGKHNARIHTRPAKGSQREC